MSPSIREIDAPSLVSLQASAAPPLLVDVREGWEVQQGAIAGAVHLPLAELVALAARQQETPGAAPPSAGPGALLPEDRGTAIVTYCHHGMRSLRAAQALQALGYTEVASLKGGIDAWATDVDASVGRY